MSGWRPNGPVGTVGINLDLLRRIEEGEIDPTFIIRHRAKLEDGPALYETFRDKKDGCIKVALTA